MSRPKIKERVGILCVEDDFISFVIEGRTGNLTEPEFISDFKRKPRGNRPWFRISDFAKIVTEIESAFREVLPFDMFVISTFGGVYSRSGYVESIARQDVEFNEPVNLRHMFARLVKGREERRVWVYNDTVSMAFGHAVHDSQLIAYAHIGRGVGCGIVQGDKLLQNVGTHGEYGQMRARLDDWFSLTEGEYYLYSNCKYHGGEHDKSTRKTPCLDGLLARTTLDQLPPTIDLKRYFLTFAAQFLATVALTGVPIKIYVGGSALKHVFGDAEEAMPPLREAFGIELSGYPSFPMLVTEMNEKPLDEYLVLSKWETSEKAGDGRTAAVEGASKLAWFRLAEIAD